MAKRCLMIGAGGFAGSWIRGFLQGFEDRMEIVGLVDINLEALNGSGDFLGLPDERRFTDMGEAFSSVESDFCIIVIPPSAHKEAVMHAVQNKIDILSEKPIADSWNDCVEIFRAVKGSGIKMTVIQNYRYNPVMLTMRQVLRDGSLGRTNYIMGRFAADYRKYGSWGAFRHEIEHSLLIEGAVHHFDMLRNLSGGDPVSIAGWEWNPEWSSFKGDCCNLYLVDMSNGIKASYEGSCTAAGAQNSWHHEYYRAECENGAVAVGRDGIVRIYEFAAGKGLKVAEVPNIRPEFEGHRWIINEFLNWLDGGSVPDTVVDDNIKSVAMVFAAIEASRKNSKIDIKEMIRL